MRDEVEWWYGQAKALAEGGQKGDESRARVVMGMLGKVMADRKEREAGPAGAKQPFVFQVIGDLQRGTLEAVENLRRGAIEVGVKEE